MPSDPGDLTLSLLPPSPNTSASLSLLNDLSRPLQGDRPAFHFEVIGLTLGKGQGHIKLLIDNDRLEISRSQFCEVEGLLVKVITYCVHF